MTTSTPEPEHSRLRTLAIPIAVILIVGAANLACLIAWRSSLPEPLATHFDIGGRANGFMSWTANLTTTLLLATALPLGLFGAFHAGGHGHMARPAAALATGVAGLVTTVSLTGVGLQRGLADAHDAHFGWGWIGVGLAGALALGGLTYVLVPAGPSSPSSAATLPRMSLRPGERAVWSSERTGRSLLVIGLVLAIGGLAWTLARREAIPGLIFAATGAMTASLGHVRVVVDDRGLTWRMGLFSRRIPLSRITSAREVDVSPTAYGGWGYRISGEGHAIVMGAGPGLRITRRDASDLTVTVPDAETGAALLNTLVGRSPQRAAEHRA